MQRSVVAMKRLLFTGAPGWLASAFFDSLRTQPLPGLEEIVCLVAAGMAFEPPVIPGIRLRVVSGLLQNPASLAPAVADCDAVLHAAGVIHVRRTRDWYDINATGTRHLVDAALAAGTVKRFVFVSTNAAGGRSPSAAHLLTETDPFPPASHYGRSKLLGEEALQAARSLMESVVLRPCMFYGPPVPARHVDVYRRLMHGRMPLVGDGQYARSLTHIDHLVQACHLALTHPRAAGETFYIADAAPSTTRGVVEAMARALGVTPRYLRLPALSAQTAYALDSGLAALGFYSQSLHLLGEADWHVGVSSEKATRLLGYAPTRTLDEGMASAVAWCRARGLLG